MPIIEPHDSDAPLNQGDLLRDVSLFLTSKADTVEGGESTGTKFKFCMVLSRPCVIAHKPTVIVAGVDNYKSPAPSEIDSFKKAKHFLDKLRDGDDTPDQFYLGQLLGDTESGRYAARLDSIHTIRLPAKPEHRTEFVKKHRYARLSEDFRRDLHTRLFQAFSVLGFDDLGWYSLADLRYLVQTGRSEIQRHNASIAQFEAAQAAEGSKEKDIIAIRNQIKEVERQMADHVAELTRREAPA